MLGGGIECDGVVGGKRTNYDGELAHKLDIMSALPGARLFYIFDSASPIMAGERFRRLSTSARSQCECDDWQGSAMTFEQGMGMVAYWWSIRISPIAGTFQRPQLIT